MVEKLFRDVSSSVKGWAKVGEERDEVISSPLRLSSKKGVYSNLIDLTKSRM